MLTVFLPLYCLKEAQYIVLRIAWQYIAICWIVDPESCKQIVFFFSPLSWHTNKYFFKKWLAICVSNPFVHFLLVWSILLCCREQWSTESAARAVFTPARPALYCSGVQWDAVHMWFNRHEELITEFLSFDGIWKGCASLSGGINDLGTKSSNEILQICLWCHEVMPLHTQRWLVAFTIIIDLLMYSCVSECMHMFVCVCRHKGGRKRR